MRKRNFKRLVVAADPHCGHIAGLTPPDWHYNFETHHPRTQAIYEQQKAMWDWYTRRIDALKPIDRAVWNGDLVDGKGKKSGGTEQRTMDGNEQAQMAAECINYMEAPKVCLIYGTPYHTGTEEDMEDAVVPLVNGMCKIKGHAFLETNGRIFDVKHFVGASSIPHGRWTSTARDKLQNIQWNNEYLDGRKKQDPLQPNADFLIRAHVHYHIHGGAGGDWEFMTCPALQGFGSKYGVRICSGVVHVGFLVFDIQENGDYKWWSERARLESQKVDVWKF